MKNDFKTTKCVFAGVFDPFTNGHLNIVTRAAEMFGEVLIAVADNALKKPVLDAESRLSLVKKAVKAGNVNAALCRGMLIDFCRENGVRFIVKGVRNAADFDYENEMFKANASLGGVDTLLLPAAPQLSFVSSSFVKELLRLGKDVSAFVPPEIVINVVSAYSPVPALRR